MSIASRTVTWSQRSPFRRCHSLRLTAPPAAPLSADPPVLILTTYDTQTDILAAVEAGAMGYLLKDSPEDELHEAVVGSLTVAVGHRLNAIIFLELLFQVGTGWR